MSEPMITVTITGITGKFARSLVKFLLEKPNIHINGTTRNASKAPKELSHERITLFETTAEDVDGLRKALKGADVVVCCYLGWHDVMLQGQKTLIDAAIAENVPRYIAGDWTVDFRKLQVGDHEGKDDMIHVAAYLDERKDKIKAVHILLGGFIETMLTPFIQFYNASNDEFKAFDGGKNKLDCTTYADGAAVTAEVVADKNAHGYIEVAGDSQIANQVVNIYNEVYGTNGKFIDAGSSEEAKKKLAEMKKASPYNPMPWMGLNYDIICFNGSCELSNPDNSRFPNIKFTTLKDYFQRTKKEDLPSAVGSI